MSNDIDLQPIIKTKPIYKSKITVGSAIFFLINAQQVIQSYLKFVSETNDLGWRVMLLPTSGLIFSLLILYWRLFKTDTKISL